MLNGIDDASEIISDEEYEEDDDLLADLDEFFNSDLETYQEFKESKRNSEDDEGLTSDIVSDSDIRQLPEDIKPRYSPKAIAAERLAEIDNEETAKLLDDLDFELDDDQPTEHLAEPLTVEAEPMQAVALQQPQVEPVALIGLLNSTKADKQDLLSRVGEIFDIARNEAYDGKLDRELWGIIVKLIDNGETPAQIFHKRKTKGAVTAYHRRLQVADMYYVWRNHRGRKSFESFSGIFEGDTFNLELAEKIALKNLPMYGKKGKNGKIDDDALVIPEYIQDRLAVLISDKVRQRQDDKAKAEALLINRKHDIEAHLRAYKTATGSRLDMPMHLAVWEARERTGGDRAKVKDIIQVYLEITGKSINRETLRDKIKQLKKALSWGLV